MAPSELLPKAASNRSTGLRSSDSTPRTITVQRCEQYCHEQDQELLLKLDCPCDSSTNRSQLLQRLQLSDVSQQKSDMHLVIAITPNSALGKEPSINLDMPWRSDEVLDACELDHGPSNASISPAIDKPCNDYVFDAIEWDPGPQSACRLEVATSKRRSDYDLKQSLEPTSLVSAIPNKLQTIQVFRVNECFTSGSKNIAAQLASTKHVDNTLDKIV